MANVKDNTVWTVQQFQTDEYWEVVCAIFYSANDAIHHARKCNKEYGRGCTFDKDWDLVEVIDNDNCHYYDVEPFTIH